MLIETPNGSILTENYNAEKTKSETPPNIYSSIKFGPTVEDDLAPKYQMAKSLLLNLTKVNNENNDYIMIIIYKNAYYNYNGAKSGYIFDFYFKPLTSESESSKSGKIVIANDDSVMQFEQNDCIDQTLINNTIYPQPISNINPVISQIYQNANPTGFVPNMQEPSSYTNPSTFNNPTTIPYSDLPQIKKQTTRKK